MSVLTLRMPLLLNPLSSNVVNSWQDFLDTSSAFSTVAPRPLAALAIG